MCRSGEACLASRASVILQCSPPNCEGGTIRRSSREHAVQPNVFETANAGFAQALYEDYLRDPASVSPEWRRLFESGQVGERPAVTTNGASAPPVTNGAGASSTPAA